MIPEKARIRKRDESLLFLRLLLKNPKMLGAVVPSSAALANFMCRNIVILEDEYIVEIGAGTGRFSQALLNIGISPERIFLVEVDPEMCRFLKKNLPMVNVIEGDAAQLGQLLPKHIIGKVKTVISGIPLINLSPLVQKQIAESCFQVLSEQGNMLQFTYGPTSPLSAKKLGLKKKRLGHVLFNLPPAVIWSYTKG